MGHTKTWAIGLTFLCTFLTSSGQMLFKMGVDGMKLDLLSLLTNVPLMAGLFIYFVGSILVIIALRHGELSVLFPILATSYIWVTLLSAIVFGEVINTFKLMGVLTIIVGVACIGVGGR